MGGPVGVLRLALTGTQPGWRVTATLGDQSEIRDVPAADFRGMRWPCPPGEDVAVVAKRLAPTTPAEALAAGRFLALQFIPPTLTATSVTVEVDADDPALRLPWNLLADAEGHLLARGALLREIRGGVMAPITLPLPLRVLFVVAAGLDDPAIAAGAEYLGLLRRLEATGRLIEHTVRITPTRAELEGAIRSFRPAVLHWIGHGDATHLRLPTDRDHPTISATQLAQLCEKIPVLVLNACHSAGSDDPSVPLAVAAVRAGVPVVVGMQGRVKDRACRLFTWQLYQALADGQPLAAAVAEGQRAGLEGLEWARPAVFQRVGTTLTLDASHLPAARHAAEVRRQFQPRRDYFCGRFEVLAAAADLKSPTGGTTTALLLRLHPRDLTQKGDKVGLTWLLDELGGHLATAGRVPVELLFHDITTEVPVGWKALAEALSAAVGHSRKGLGLPGKGVALRAFADGFAAVDPRDLIEEFVAALARDCADLAQDSGRTPVLLLDDLHRLGRLGADLLREGLGRHGLGTQALPVPLVATFVESDQPEYAGPVAALRAFADTAPQAVRVLPVGPFTGDEEQVAYRQFLVGQRVPVVLSGADDVMAQQLLQFAIRGVPSCLPTEGARMLALMRTRGLVEVADDEALMKVMP
jgi:hypothetical protein